MPAGREQTGWLDVDRLQVAPKCVLNELFKITFLFSNQCVNNLKVLLIRALTVFIIFDLIYPVNSGLNVTIDKTRLVNVKLSGYYTNEVSLGNLKHHVFIYRLYDKWKLYYRSFCTGSIISENRVLTSAHCFYTNRKRLKRSLDKIRVVGGILHTVVQQPPSHEVQQWRNAKRVYSQRFFRFPAFNLAVVEINKQWTFNQFVNKIPYSQKNYDFDGVCMGVILKSTRSWSKDKNLFTTDLKIRNQRSCEQKLLRSCWQYYCTEYDSALASTETEGGGLICYGTGDPAENEESGVLVGVTSLINRDLPSLHVRIGIFHKWVSDTASIFKLNIIIPCISISLSLIHCQ